MFIKQPLLIWSNDFKVIDKMKLEIKFFLNRFLRSAKIRKETSKNNLKVKCTKVNFVSSI